MKDLINCVIIDDDKMHASITKQMAERVDFLNVVAVCTDAVDASKQLSENKIDLVFLDMEMPQMSGFDFINMLNIKPRIIVTSGHKEYAFEAFDYDVTDYIMKPFDFPRFLKAVMKVRDELKSGEAPAPSEGRDFIFLKTSTNIVKLKLEDILYVEALGDYMKVVSYDGSHITHSTLKRLEKILPADTFQRAHRSFVVNIHKIKKIQDETIQVEETVIPIGKSYKAELFNKLKIV